MTKKFTPVLQHKLLTPFYNYILILSGLGPSFRRRIHTLSNLTPDKDLMLVDIGCGTGIDISLLNKRFPNLHLIGVDPDDQLVQQNKIRFQRTPNVQFKNGFAEALPLQDNSVDYAYSALTFHHLTPMRNYWQLKKFIEFLKTTACLFSSIGVIYALNSSNTTYTSSRTKCVLPHILMDH